MCPKVQRQQHRLLCWDISAWGQQSNIPRRLSSLGRWLRFHRKDWSKLGFCVVYCNGILSSLIKVHSPGASLPAALGSEGNPINSLWGKLYRMINMQLSCCICLMLLVIMKACIILQQNNNFHTANCRLCLPSHKTSQYLWWNFIMLPRANSLYPYNSPIETTLITPASKIRQNLALGSREAKLPSSHGGNRERLSTELGRYDTGKHTTRDPRGNTRI